MAGAAGAAASDGRGHAKEQISQMRKEFGSFVIEPQEFEYLEQIGSGSFGHVYRGKCRGQEVAIKKLKGQELTAEQLEELRREVEIMSQIYHPNVVLFMGACFKRGHMAMFTELMPEGSVSELIRNAKAKVTLLNKLQIAKQTARGMNWLHTRNPVILHRDLKPANLLIDKDWNVKICDFGLSTAVERGKMWEDEDDIPGTPLWMAPEVMLGKQIDGKADVYSFGLCVWELFSCEEPYSQFTNFNEFRKAICSKNVRPKVPANMPANIAQLAIRCWDGEPKVRPTFDELLPILENLILESMIADEQGRDFWRTHFARQGDIPLEVGWDKFITELLTFLKLPLTLLTDPGTRCVKTLIAEDSRHPGGDPIVVHINKFGNCLDWFGPLERDAGMEHSIFRKVEETAAYKPKKKSASHVFHGDIDSAEAEKLLTGQEKGTWLIRVSPKERSQPFVISKVSRQGAINHQRVNYDHKTKRFRLEIQLKQGAKQAESQTDSLIEFLRTLRETLYLRAACPGSKYGAVFTEAVVSGYLPS